MAETFGSFVFWNTCFINGVFRVSRRIEGGASAADSLGSFIIIDRSWLLMMESSWFDSVESLEWLRSKEGSVGSLLF